jgi:outer membrane protein TolC
MHSRAHVLIAFSVFLAAPSWGVTPGAGDASEAPAPADTLQLQKLVSEAMERNPEILAARRAIDAKRARVPQARAWPDPKVSFSYAGNPLPFTLMPADPSSARELMAEQEIPYPGKTRLRGEVAAREADAESLAYEGVWRRITADVKEAYFGLYFIDQSLLILGKNRELLQTLAKIAEIRYSVGKAAQQDVLKAQVEVSKLAERQTMLEQARETLRAQLNSLRDLPVDAPVGIPGEVRPTVLPYVLSDLLAAAQSNYPVLKQQQTMVEGNRLTVDLARREVRPDFSLGYLFMQRTAQPSMYGITFSTTLPIFRRNKQNQAIAEAAANLDSSRRMVENELTTLRYRVKQEYLQAQAASDLLTLYSKAILPQSSLTWESALSNYQVGTTDFLTVLSNFTTVLDYQLAYQEQLANHEKALARLEELTALDLIH